MPASRPFPALEGGCFCRQTRYRMQSAPLFVHACHCSDCQKSTGSAFACFVSIEADRVTSIGPTQPLIKSTSPGRKEASCPQCKTTLWACGDWSPATIDIKVGTLDFPNLMEPDMHIFIEGKLNWVILPEGARTCKGQYDPLKTWPKSSLARLDAAIAKVEKAKESAEKQVTDGREAEGRTDDEEELDKTPTAQSPEEKEEDDEIEKRYQEVEAMLQERLEKLSLKLSSQEKEPAKVEQSTTESNNPAAT